MTFETIFLERHSFESFSENAISCLLCQNIMNFNVCEESRTAGRAGRAGRTQNIIKTPNSIKLCGILFTEIFWHLILWDFWDFVGFIYVYMRPARPARLALVNFLINENFIV